MRRRFRSFQDPLLPFSTDADGSAVALAEPPDAHDGGDHAIQDDHSRAAGAAADTLQPVPPGTQTPRRDRSNRPGLEDPARSLDGGSGGEAGYRSEPDSQHGAGDGAP